MPNIEIKTASSLSRKEVSERLIALGRALASGSEVQLGSGGDSITVVVANEVRWELEIEVDGTETEIEIEISWRDDPGGEDRSAPATKTTATKISATKSAAATPAKAARRTGARKRTAK